MILFILGGISFSPYSGRLNRQSQLMEHRGFPLLCHVNNKIAKLFMFQSPFDWLFWWSHFIVRQSNSIVWSTNECLSKWIINLHVNTFSIDLNINRVDNYNSKQLTDICELWKTNIVSFRKIKFLLPLIIFYCVKFCETRL